MHRRSIRSPRATRSPSIFTTTSPVTRLANRAPITDRAAEKKVTVYRYTAGGERISFLVNLRLIKRGKAEDPVLQKDDLVLVPEAFF